MSKTAVVKVDMKLLSGREIPVIFAEGHIADLFFSCLCERV